MIEKLLEFIAPDECAVCKKEGVCVCSECAKIHMIAKKPACPICNTLNETGQTCRSCKNKTKLAGATIAYRYDGVAKELIGQMKYEGKRSVGRYFGGALKAPYGLKNHLVAYVPSDGASRRRRGYDQAHIIAKSFAKNNSANLTPLLIRKRHVAQVGKGRRARLENVRGDFVAKRTLQGENVILIDDVITTGATASECAKTLKDAGAGRVWLLAVAKG